MLPFIAALVGSIFIQIGTNLSNDYSDARRGADTEDRLGPVRVTSATSTMVREVVTSTRRPERVATISNPRTLPLPVSTSTSTLSPRIPGSLAPPRRTG